MLLLQRRMNEMNTPIRVVNVRPTPSYTMFVAQADAIGRIGNRRTVTMGEIRRSLSEFAEEQRTWRIGLVPNIADTPDAFGVILRTEDHGPMSLRRLLVRTSFREHPSTLALALGTTLEQRLIVRDLAAVGNLLVIGEDHSRQRLLQSILLSLTLLNTPGEIRLAVVGEQTKAYAVFADLPHALGGRLTKPEHIERLLKGMVNELKRRQQTLAQAGTANIAAYNSKLTETDHTSLPRILLVIDSLSDEVWQAHGSAWGSLLYDLLTDQGKAGVHLLVTSAQSNPDQMPDELISLLPLHLLTQSAGRRLSDQLEHFHPSLLRFVDLFIVENNDTITPVEISTVSSQEVKNAIAYWRKATRQREQSSTSISSTAGVTAMLNATRAIEPAQSTQAVPYVTGQLNAAALLREESADLDFPTDAIGDVYVHQAQALAAYLGWIGVGPLQDILGLRTKDAETMLTLLRKTGVVEDNDNPTPRFVRLVEWPKK
jgi:hypothetical protein